MIAANSVFFLELRSIDDLCELLKVSPRLMERVIEEVANGYREFQVPKAKGGFRLIEAPNVPLKRIQKLINYHLQQVYNRCRSEAVHGFVSNMGKTVVTRNIVTNAQCHIGAKQVLNLDMLHFFHSISVWRVKQLFMSYPFYFGNDLASYLAILTTYKDRLPMGAPTSPVISNFACFMLDRRLMQVAGKYGLTYSRYADDITFSGGEHINAVFLQDVLEVIHSEGFRVNDNKTRLFTSFGRQTVTGLKVNERVNVDRDFIRSIRAMLHNWQKYGVKRASFRNKSEEQFVRVLKGKLDFLGMVRGTKDDIYLKFLNKFDMLRRVGGY